MKNKNKIYFQAKSSEMKVLFQFPCLPAGRRAKRRKAHLFAAALLFLGVFLVRADKVNYTVKAASNCACEDGTYECECGDDGYTEDEYNNDYENMDDQTFCEMYPDECTDDTSTTSTSDDYTYSQCLNEGYKQNECCNLTGSPSDCGSSATNSSSSDDYTYDQCLKEGYKKSECCNLTGSPSDCSDTSSATTSTCDASDSCMFWNCCSSSGGGTSSSSSSGQIVKTNQDMKDSNGKTYPAGTSINTSTGVATLPDGSTVTLPSSDLDAVNSAISGDSSLTLCANAAYGQICETTGGSGSPFVVTLDLGGGGYSTEGGLPYSVVGGTTTAKCGAGFTPVGGVCFPTQTGLSNASVYSILVKIFSWLMMLFTTLAVGAFVISGIQYLMSAGDESLAETAKKNAVNAVLGIIVGLSSFIIIKAIAAALSGSGYLF